MLFPMKPSATQARLWTSGLLLSLLGLLVGCDFIASFRQKEKVYVTASVLNLRETPTTKARVAMRLNRGYELEILERKDKWIKVKSGGEDNGQDVIGWVHGDYVGQPSDVRAAQNGDLRRRTSGRRKIRSTPARPEPEKGQPSSEVADASLLNLSIEDMLAGFPEDVEVEVLHPIAGESRYMGATAEGQVVVEFWGNPENLSRASMTVSVVDVPDEHLTRNAVQAVRFVRNAVPQWNREGGWMADKLRELTSLDIGEGGFDAGGKKVRFKFIKPLGSIRVSVEPRTL